MALTVLANVQSDEASTVLRPPRACTINMKYTKSLMKSAYTVKAFLASHREVQRIFPHEILKYEN